VDVNIPSTQTIAVVDMYATDESRHRTRRRKRVRPKRPNSRLTTALRGTSTAQRRREGRLPSDAATLLLLRPLTAPGRGTCAEGPCALVRLPLRLADAVSEDLTRTPPMWPSLTSMTP
jgi:hypothetical protein